MNTREVFEILEFKENWEAITDQQPGYFCDFGNLRLGAVQVTNQYLQPVFLVTGVWRSPRTLAMIESYLPLTVASFEQGVAWIAYAIGDDFVPQIPKAWLNMGRGWQEQLPWEIDRRVYAARPQCVVERDWFRVAAKKLREAVPSALDDELAWFGFDGTVLSITRSDGALVMPASGKGWPGRYAVQVKTLKFISQRLSDPIYLSIWKERLSINRRTFQIVEVELIPNPEADASRSPPQGS